MVYIKEYWEQKEKGAQKAIRHTETMAKHYPTAIKNAIANTITYDENHRFHEFDTNPDMEIEIWDMDSVRAIFKESKKWEEEGVYKRICVLNFASFKNPGGMFEQGSKAQEECLCHESFLYNVLKEKMEFYEKNRKNTNKALYFNRALYTPNVMFGKVEYAVPCDVITCAAPNLSAAQKYCNVTTTENHNALDSRIKFMLNVAMEEEIEVLILGAWGCGVFGQNPSEVARVFKKYLETTHRCFEKVIFAVPSGRDRNLEEFLRVFKKGLAA